MKNLNTQSETIFFKRFNANKLIINTVTQLLVVSLPFQNMPLDSKKRSFCISLFETLAFHFAKQKHICKSITYKKNETILKRFFNT